MSIHNNLAGPITWIAVAVSFFPGASYAIVNPETGKDSTPVVLKCRISASSSHEEGSLTIFSASCDVLEVIRSSTKISPGDNILIRYGADLRAVEKQYEEMEQKVAENPGWAGPAPDAGPRSLQPLDVLVAYLRAVVDADGYQVYVPNLGFESYEFITVRPRPRQKIECRIIQEAPIMSNVKACEELRVRQQTDKLDQLVRKIHASIHDRRSMGREKWEETSLTAQASTLGASQVAWEQYRDETCEFAYYQNYPGSMARLMKLTCLRQLTERRIAQLDSVYFTNGNSSPEY